MKKNTLLAPAESGVCSLLEPVQNVAHGIVSRAVITTPGLRLTLFHFAASQELSEHTSPARVLVQAVEGECEFTVDGQPRPLKPGELLHLPPRAPHAVRAVTDLTFLVIQATPPAK